MPQPTRRALLGTVLATPPILAHAQGEWPSRTLSWVVPFTPGGITDTNARLVAQGLSQRLGQNVIIENRPGAGGSIGTDAVARAAPDGYTMVYGTLGTLCANPVLYPAITTNATRDFAAVHGLTDTPNLLVANPDRPFRDVAGLVAHARANPEKVTFASSGIGTGTHLAAALFEYVADIRMTQVPYRGSAPALTDLVAGRTDIMFDYLISAGPHVRERRLRALAMTTAERMAVVPDIPAIAETLPGAEARSWSGIFMPARTPAPILARLAQEMAAVLRDPSVVRTLASGGSTPLMMATDAFQAFVATEMPRWRAVIERSGARAG
jgi:tripartite-type tricarboxylate transporter receptor subunit TctC